MIDWNRYFRLIVLLGVLALLLIMSGITCTQKNPIDATSSEQRETYLLVNMSANPEQVPVGGFYSNIRVRLINQDGEPVADRVISFTTTSGTIESADTTDEDGWASVVLTSGLATGEVKVTAKYGAISSSIKIYFISSSKSNFQIDINPKVLYANGVDTAVVQVTVLDDSSRGVQGAEVTFSTSAGTISPVQAVTNSEGIASAILTSCASSQDVNVTVQAVSDTNVIADYVKFVGVQLGVSAYPDIIIADGESTSKISAVLKETTSQVAISDAEIRFATTKGLIPNKKDTDSRGLAEVELTSTSSPDTAVVVAHYGEGITASDTVIFASEAAGMNTIYEITTSSRYVFANGENFVDISVTVVDDKGSPVFGQQVNFSVTPNVPGVDSTAVVVTDVNGIATFKMIPDTVSSDIDATVSAYLDDPSSTVSVDVEIIEVTLTVSAVPSSIIADGSSTSTVTAILKRKSTNIAIAGEKLYFGTNHGTIPGEAETNASGVAQVLLTSSSTPQTANVEVSYGNKHADPWPLQVSFVSEAAAGDTITELSATSSMIYANGENYSRISAVVRDGDGNPVSGRTVHFAVTPSVPGVSTPVSAVTNSSGIATFDLIPDTVSSDIDATVSAYLDDPSSTVSVDVEIIEVTLTVSAVPSSIIADGSSTSTVTAILKRKSTNIAIAGEKLYFGTNHGTIPGEAETNASGVAQVLLTSSSTPQTANVEVSYGNKHADPWPLQVSFVSEAAAGDTITELSATSSMIYANGENYSRISAVVRDGDGNPVSGRTVHFAVTPSVPGVSTPVSAVTNSSGIATFDLIPDTVSSDIDATVSAYLSDPSNSVDVDIDIVKVSLTVTAFPDEIPADGNSTSTISAVLKRSSTSIAIAGENINFATDAGTIPAYAETNQSGVAQVSLKSSTSPDTAHVLVTYGDVKSSPYPIDVKFTETVGEPANITVTAYTGGDPQNVITELPADGVTTATIRAVVKDEKGMNVSGETVKFSTTVGDITPSAQTDGDGVAEVQFSSSEVGIAQITARVDLSGGGNIYDIINITLTPGPPQSVLLRFSPNSMGVKDSGKNQTVTVYADVKDSKNNPVEDGTKVVFHIIQSPSGNETMSPSEGTEISTVGGTAQASFKSDTVSGTAKIQAEVTEDSDGNPVTDVRSIATEIVIHSGPPYMEDIADSSTTHLTIVPRRLNIYAGLDTTLLSVSISDKYMNEVQEGTAVYVSTTGGKVIMDDPSTSSTTNEDGIATFILQAQDPYPDTTRWRNTFENPNIPGRPIYGDPPDFDNDGHPNHGIARILAYTNGVDDNKSDIKVWNICSVVISHNISHYNVYSDKAIIAPGEAALITIEVWDVNGNPVVSGSTLSASYAPSSVSAELSWQKKTTADPGSCYYYLYCYNTIDPTDPNAIEGDITITVSISSVNGLAEGSVTIHLSL